MVLRAHTAQLYVAGCWRSWARSCWWDSLPYSPVWFPRGIQAGLLRVSLAAYVITQTLVAAGAS